MKMPPSLRFLLLGLPLLSGLYACKLDTRLPETPVTCGPRGECPSGTQCRASLNRCFTLSNDVEAPQFTVAPTVTPTTGRLDTEFSVSFSVSEDLADLPIVTGVCDVGQTVSFTTGSSARDRAFTFVWRVDTAAPQGFCRVQVQAFDRSGNIATTFATPAFFVDSRPPTPSIAGLEFAAAPDTPVPEVSALGLGGRAFINFSTDEAVNGLPEMSAVPPVLDFAALSFDGGVFRTTATLKADAGASAGELTLRVTLTDLGGASGVRPLQTSVPFLFDGDPPRVRLDAGIEHLRVPRGAPSTQGQPQRSITGGPGSLEAAIVVRALSTDGLTEFARGTTDATGAFTLMLPEPDQALVALEAIDRAGNRSALTLVPQVEFRVVPDFDTRVNGTTGDGLLRTDGLTDVRQTLSRADGVRVVVEGNGSWRNRGQTRFRSAAPTTDAPCMAYNPATARMIYWLAAQVHVSNGLDTQLVLGNPLRGYGAMTYDRRRGVLVTFGGLDNEEVQESPDGRVWRTINPINGPGPRQRHILVFDGEATQMLGSPDGGPILRWNGVTWSAVDSGGMPNGVVAAAYDSQKNEVIALASAAAEAPDTWRYRDGRWQPVAQVDTIRPPSSIGGMVYDSRSQLIRFNGRLPDGGAERWSYYGDFWRDDGVGVPTSANAATAFDEAHGVWLHSGLIGRPEDFRFLVAIEDGGLRTVQTQNSAPSIRYATGTTWDPVRRALVTQGGTTTSLQTPADQWAFNGTTWAQDLAVTSLPNLFRHTLTWSEAGTVIFGGIVDGGTLNGQTWVGGLGGGFYRLVSDAGPTPRSDHSAISTDGTNVLVLGGVNNDGLLWSFNGTQWVSTDGGTVARRQRMALVQEPTTSTLMAIGGSATASSTDATIRAAIDDAIYLGGPNQWQRVAQLPGPRDSVAAAVDTDRHLVLAMGGRRPDSTATDEFLAIAVRDGGTTVTPIDTSDPESDGDPLPRYLHSAVYDPGRHVMLVYSGYNGATGFYDLWEYRFRGQRPSITASLDSREVDFSGASTVTLTVSAAASAHGYSDTLSDVDGYAIEAFIDGHWVELGRDSTRADGGVTSLTVTTAPLSVQQLAATLQRVSVRLVSLGSNGLLPATLTVDALDVSVRFTRTP